MCKHHHTARTDDEMTFVRKNNGGCRVGMSAREEEKGKWRNMHVPGSY